jgi:hypothetical protein
MDFGQIIYAVLNKRPAHSTFKDTNGATRKDANDILHSMIRARNTLQHGVKQISSLDLIAITATSVKFFNLFDEGEYETYWADKGNDIVRKYSRELHYKN